MSNLFYKKTRTELISNVKSIFENSSEIKLYFENKKYIFPSFGYLLFRQMITSYSCDKLATLVKNLDKCGNINDTCKVISELAPKSKMQSVTEYICGFSFDTIKKDSLNFAYEILNLCCRKGNKICKTCNARNILISVFEKIENMNRRSAERNISNWLSDASVPHSRNTYIILCYALNLRIIPYNSQNSDNQVMDADYFLSFCCKQNPLHPSNLIEASHYFALKQPYGKDFKFSKQYDSVENYNYAIDLSRKISDKRICSKLLPQTSDSTYCHRRKIDDIVTEKDFEEYAQNSLYRSEDDYLSGRMYLRYFIREYENAFTDYDCIDLDVTSTVNKTPIKLKEHSKSINKQECLLLINRLTNLQTVDIDYIISVLTMQPLGEILYSSGILHNIVNSTAKIDREIILLTILALNFGINPSVEKLMYSSDLTETKDFDNFFDILNGTLYSCSLYPLTPANHLDFVVLYTYYIMRRDIDDKKQANSLSYYLIEALRAVKRANS